MTFLLDDQTSFIYNQMRTPSNPRFNVGDIVYTKAQQVVGGYRLGMNIPNHLIQEYANRNNITHVDITVEPAIFGVIIDVPVQGTILLDSETIRHRGMFEWCLEEEEDNIIDIPGSGSTWYLPDEERRYFVKWLNKEPRTKCEKAQQNYFRPLKNPDGSQVNNISLHYEDTLHKAPDFIKKIKKLAKVNKELVVSDMLNIKLGIDYYSTKGLVDMICAF